MSGLGLALKPGLGLGFVGLWLHILEAKAKALGEGLAWPGFGLSQGFGDFFNRPVMSEHLWILSESAISTEVAYGQRSKFIDVRKLLIGVGWIAEGKFRDTLDARHEWLEAIRGYAKQREICLSPFQSWSTRSEPDCNLEPQMCFRHVLSLRALSSPVAALWALPPHLISLY
ncbi:hypothetical protein C8R44DRAFT_740827 [Mycena epipterygia]|nr:hypothetical protein C8R44DRAFT_740827 [Mycena epipterygia]